MVLLLPIHLITECNISLYSICLPEESSKLWKFLKSDPSATLPKAWLRYIKFPRRDEVHTTSCSYPGEGENSFYDDWRINYKNFVLDIEKVEELCREQMVRSGYNFMQNERSLMNLSKSTLGKIDCEYLNCY